MSGQLLDLSQIQISALMPLLLVNSFLQATTDIATDAWTQGGLKRQIGPGAASTIQSVAQRLGFFTSISALMALTSKDFASNFFGYEVIVGLKFCIGSFAYNPHIPKGMVHLQSYSGDWSRNIGKRFQE